MKMKLKDAMVVLKRTMSEVDGMYVNSAGSWATAKGGALWAPSLIDSTARLCRARFSHRLTAYYSAT